VVAVDLVESSRAWSNLHERLSVLVNENALARDDDGSPFLVPTGVLLAGRPRAAEGEIIRAVRDAFLLESRLLLGRELAGLLLAPSHAQGEREKNDQAARLELILHRRRPISVALASRSERGAAP
jgi:hypothetical protein